MVKQRPRRTATTRVVTEINRTAIIDALRERGPLSRRQLADGTGLSPATVERLAGALLEEGLIEYGALAQSSGGRPSRLLRYSGGARAVVVAEVSSTAVRGRILGFDGAWIADAEHSRPLGAQPQARLDGVLEFVDELLHSAHESGLSPKGIGVVVPGIVHRGVVTTTAELGWRELPLESILAERTGLPVVLENDANAIAFGEWARGAAREATTVASFVLGAGVGAGIVSDGVVYRGARSAAGEIGFLFADVDAMKGYFADRGDLESRIGDIAREIAPDADSILAAVEQAVDACAAGRTTPEQTARLFDLLAFSMGAIAVMFDTEVVVVAGVLLRASDFAIAEIERRLLGRIPSPPRLLPASLGEVSALTGAGEIIIRHVRGSIYLA